MSHIFLSYSTKNAAYAYKLADKLREEGFDVWIDNEELRASDNWWESIVRALRAASAFVVIMTSESRESRWVQREVALADKWSKPSFPLLLEGEEFEIYVLTHFRIVRDGNLPGEKFYDDLARFAKRENRKGQVVTEDTKAQAPNDAAIREALVNAPQPETTKKLTAKELLPAPFDWCEIPAGKVVLRGNDGSYIPAVTSQVFHVPKFRMAKYPITNAQYAVFVDAGGYQNEKWWTKAGWVAKQKGWEYSYSKFDIEATGKEWTEPRFWKDKNFMGKDKPVVGVSWHECIAFCRWLREATGEKILLPTEQQWQRAAQAQQDGSNSYLAYVWGNTWKSRLCNNSVMPEASDQTTPVTKFEEKGNSSPCGVVDLIGNVWEWCLTQYKTGDTTLNGSNTRCLRGGSWYTFNLEFFSVNFRDHFNPASRTYDWGFRICRTL